MEVSVILDFFIGNIVPGSRVKAPVSASSSSEFPHSFLGVLQSYLVCSLIYYFRVQ